MANMHKHPLRGIRGIEDRLWEDLDTYAKAAGSDRSNVTRQLWEWYIGRPAAELPERPTAGAVLQQVTEGRPQARRILDEAIHGGLPERPVGSEEKNA